jgi:predicted dehydrogenase
MGINANDLAASFTLQQGGCGTLIGTCAMAWHHALFELVLTFERGRIHLRGLDGPMEVLDAAGSLEETFTLTRDASQWQHYGASFEAALTAYFDALAQGAPPPVPATAGLLELQFEAALRRAVREGRCVDVAREFPLT